MADVTRGIKNDMAGSGFTRKKVGSLTLGEKLHKFRTDHRMSLVEVSRATKIQVKYLEFLENGEYNKLPADVYVKGFLRGYARHLGCDEEAILRLYERERHIQESLGKNTDQRAVPTRIEWPTVVVTTRTLWVGLIVLVIGGAFLYLVREYQSFVSAPRLIILEPSDQAIIDRAELVIHGETDQGARVLINDQPAFVGTKGDFIEKLLLQPGLNTIVVSTANRFGKERVETLHVEAVFTPEQAPMDESVISPSDERAMQLVISASEKSVNVLVMADGIKVLSGKLESGERKVISAEREIRVSSDNGQATYVEVGSESPRALSAEEQPVQDVIFAPKENPSIME